MYLQNVILLTYKNKILLSAPDIPLQKSKWDFINEKMIRTRSDYHFLENASKQTLAYIKLSDENVNSITRKNGQRLEFYSIPEIEKLPLTVQASELFFSFKAEMLKITLQ